MRIQKCWFCSANIYPGHGTTFVRSDCNVFRFCRPKCFKLFKKRLNPRKIKWTKISRKMANKELVNDPIMQFERRVDIPMIYNREVVLETIEAIPRIAEIKQRREDLFIANRILERQEESKARDLKFIEKHKRLLSNEKIEDKVNDRRILKKTEREVEYN
jgi:large subunit ribosomal protein L24e